MSTEREKWGQWVDSLKAREREAQSEIDRLKTACKFAATVFREYEQLHLAKGTASGIDKAAVNGNNAKIMEDALKPDSDERIGSAEEIARLTALVEPDGKSLAEAAYEMINKVGRTMHKQARRIAELEQHDLDSLKWKAIAESAEETQRLQAEAYEKRIAELEKLLGEAKGMLEILANKPIASCDIRDAKIYARAFIERLKGEQPK